MNKKLSKAIWSVCEQMAKHIKTRNFRQCKLHHQRMLQKYKSVGQIISSLVSSSSSFQPMLMKERDVAKKIEIDRKRQEQKDSG